MFGKLLKVLIGLAFVALGVWAIVIWWGDLLVLLRGGIGPVLIMLGLITFALVAD